MHECRVELGFFDAFFKKGTVNNYSQHCSSELDFVCAETLTSLARMDVGGSS